MEWIEILERFGLSVALVVFFVWQMHRERQGMIARLRETEDYVRSTMADVIRENTEVMRKLESWLQSREKL